jgi:hypothetical protein
MKLHHAIQILNQRLYNLLSRIGALLSRGSLKRHLPQESAQAVGGESEDKECARFPDQCPITTELGKRIP